MPPKRPRVPSRGQMMVMLAAKEKAAITFSKPAKGDYRSGVISHAKRKLPMSATSNKQPNSPQARERLFGLKS